MWLKQTNKQMRKVVVYKQTEWQHVKSHARIFHNGCEWEFSYHGNNTTHLKMDTNTD